MLERHELDAFVTLAEELHFGRTAERLRVSAAGVSQTIRRLERRVGVPLFNRNSRRVELTAVGRQLYADVQPAWAQIAAGLGRAVDAGRGVTGLLRAGFTDAAGGQLLAQVAEVFRGHHPGCEVEIRDAQPAGVLPRLRDGGIDLALVAFPVDEPGLVAGPVLVREARMLAVPIGHPLAGLQAVSAEDLAGMELLRPAPAATFQEMLTLVGAGRGVFPVGAHARRYYARPDVAYVLVRDAPPVEWGLLWPAGGATARVLAFGRAAQELIR
jgi:DNA-binding transcriptional LysR family regulator